MSDTKIFGIVNVTSDSFSDGGKYLSPEAAIAHAKKLLAEGADIIDLGAAASNPAAEAVAPELEIARLAPVLEALAGLGEVSLDTFSIPTQKWGLSRSVHWLNDILGFPDPAFYPELARSSARLVVMHNVSTRGRAEPAPTKPSGIMDQLFRFFDERLQSLIDHGITRSRLVIDPGMGLFLGSDPEVSLTVLRRLPELKARYGLPLLVSLSRKSFIRKIANVTVTEAGPASLAAELFAAAQGADYIRTHDVAALKRALRIQQALKGQTPD